MTDSIKLSATIPVDTKTIYSAWLDSEKHSAFTNSKAEIERKVGSNFTAGDGFISGTNKLLHMNKRIVQTWRSTDFPEDSEDSLLEITFEKVEKGTKVIINHSNLPEGTGKDYRKGWKDNYFKPMKEYFAPKETKEEE
jgi:activator of HSP90 ATPase